MIIMFPSKGYEDPMDKKWTETCFGKAIKDQILLREKNLTTLEPPSFLHLQHKNSSIYPLVALVRVGVSFQDWSTNLTGILFSVYNIFFISIFFNVLESLYLEQENLNTINPHYFMHLEKIYIYN